MSKNILVTGAGGFIGHHLIKHLVKTGNHVRGADIKSPEFEDTAAQEFELVDLRLRENCVKAVQDIDVIYNLAADMGGIGFISENHATVATNNVLINTHMLQAAQEAKIERFFYSSSACVYPGYKQHETDLTPLKEADAYPADPEEGYGWEKLYTEKLCQYYRDDFGLETRVARFHNVYGPLGTFEGGREKAPAAICRKIARARDGDDIEVWGDGKQTRSFMFIDDCVDGIVQLTASDHSAPINLGSDEMVTVDELVDLVSEIAGRTLTKKHDLTKPQGVRGRNSDNEMLRQVLGWEPGTSLADGLSMTYSWIAEQVKQETIESRS